ncbi:Neuropeptide Y receptor type 2 [Clonorchis sinensis]|uniref:Neuropeptide Y receptor invertebrate n=2 Tax=Clonorchis sinensis TaxID=79923 RepID=H2KV40_CLOSI|nr:Neuropeptide Y receptor type 2 [Clonorchis sinensis]GAA31719.1 neuropeptide Y receptor invertebrate [Clonorchis sinensis]
MDFPNFSINTTAPDEVNNWSTLKIISVFIYPTIMVLSTVGNSIVILTVIRSSEMRSTTNIFIANLAVSDLLITFVSMPFTPIAFYVKTWRAPPIMCRLLPWTMATSLYVSTLTSMAIAADRYIVIVHPLKRRVSPSICGIVIATVWFFSLLVTLPNAIFHEGFLNPVTQEVNCTQSWPTEYSLLVFTIVTFVLQFVVPCLNISLCYYRVSCVLRARCTAKIGLRLNSRVKEEAELHRTRRTNKMLIAMVVVLVICWIPLHSLWIIVDVLGPELQDSSHFERAFMTCHMIAMSSTVYNPFFYAWLNNNFRNEFKSFLKCRTPERKRSTSTVNNDAPRILHTYVPTKVVVFDEELEASSTRTIPKLTVVDGDGGVWRGPLSSGSTENVYLCEKQTTTCDE